MFGVPPRDGPPPRSGSVLGASQVWPRVSPGVESDYRRTERALQDAVVAERRTGSRESVEAAVAALNDYRGSYRAGAARRGTQ